MEKIEFIPPGKITENLLLFYLFIVSSPLKNHISYHTSCKMFEVSEYSRVYMLVKNGGLSSN